jgi:hypothetical protein
MTVLKVILGWCVVSTALHFTHNFAAIEQYPQSESISNTTVRAVIVVSWPLLTAIGLYAYRLHAQGHRRGMANALLALYSLTGISSLGHFVIDKVDLPLFWMAVIASDALAGAAVLAYAIWSELASAPAGADAVRQT